MASYDSTGQFRGGLGQALAVESTSDEPMTFAVRMDRTAHPTIGVEGGNQGATARVTINDKVVHSKKTRVIQKGDVYAIQCAGGAGYGKVGVRETDAIKADLVDGYISEEGARRDYNWKN